MGSGAYSGKNASSKKLCWPSSVIVAASLLCSADLAQVFRSSQVAVTSASAFAFSPVHTIMSLSIPVLRGDQLVKRRKDRRLLLALVLRADVVVGIRGFCGPIHGDLPPSSWAMRDDVAQAYYGTAFSFMSPVR